MAYDLRWSRVSAADPVPTDFATRGSGALGDRPVSANAALIELASADTDLTAIVGRYGMLTLPVSLLYASDDQVISPSVDGDRTVAAITGATQERIDGGHMLPMTRPNASAAFIRAWAERTFG